MEPARWRASKDRLSWGKPLNDGPVWWVTEPTTEGHPTLSARLVPGSLGLGSQPEYQGPDQRNPPGEDSLGDEQRPEPGVPDGRRVSPKMALAKEAEPIVSPLKSWGGASLLGNWVCGRELSPC